MSNGCMVSTTDMTTESLQQKPLPLSLPTRHELDEVQQLVVKDPLRMSSGESVVQMSEEVGNIVRAYLH